AKGSKDPRVAIAYVKFMDLFYDLDPMAKTNKYKYSQSDYEVLDKLADNVIPPVLNYKTTTISTSGIMWDLTQCAIGGGDISQSISNFKDSFQNCIDYALKQK
ncbi:MAG: hypothetical protein ACI4F7_12480, partial [Acutalibacteraceae bacterium]